MRPSSLVSMKGRPQCLPPALGTPMTLEEAGERMGRSHALLSRIERRLVGLTQPTLDEMSRVYRVTRGTILDGPPNKDD
jgi:transcriptional regulator with XRE-family HTH domain